MSWGYWGIVTGLVVLVATLFVCLESVSSRSKASPESSPPVRDRPGEPSQETTTGSRLAA